jgi:serine protease SohB
MEDFLFWLCKTATIVAFLGIAMGLLFVALHNLEITPGKLVVRNLNKQYAAFTSALKVAGIKSEKMEEPEKKANAYLLTFKGDVAASEVERLRQEVTAILQTAKKKDQVIVQLDSPGGMVHSYGFAASQLLRLRESGISVTVCVDHVAASGGYMMACVANRIVAAPFAVVGSIGVVAQVPNLHNWLKKRDIDYTVYTAGEHKRTLTVFGKNTEEGEKKFKERLGEVHELFKNFVTRYREIDIEQVATGETWYGDEALDIGLVDEVKTSDDILLDLAKDHNLYHFKFVPSKTWAKRMGESAQACISGIMLQFLSGLHSKEIFKQ